MIDLISYSPMRQSVAIGETIEIVTTSGGMYPYENVAYRKNGSGSFNTLPLPQIVDGNWVWSYEVTSQNVNLGDTLEFRITNSSGVQNITSYIVVDVVTTPSIVDFQIVRCNQNNEEAEDGTSLMIKSLKIAAAEGVTGSDLSASQLTVGNTVVSLSDTVLDAALTSAGYSETAPGVLSGYTFLNSNAFTGELLIGTTYESATWDFVIARAFANMHLCGLSSGGVAFGGFSSSSQGVPKFECHYPAYFYAGIVQGATESYADTNEIDTGAVWIDGKHIYRQIFIGTVSNTSSAVLGTINDFNELVDLRGRQKTNAGAFFPPNHTNSSASTYGRAYVSNAGAVTVQSSTSGRKDYVIIVYYTKTST